MIAVRIWKKLESPIASLPELDPLVGKTVQMIVMEEAADSAGDEHAPPDPLMTPASPLPAVAPPEPPQVRRRVRVCGMVDRVSDGGDTFCLVVDENNAIPCAWAAEGPSLATGAAGRRMVFAGTGIFDETGQLLRVDVKAGAAASAADIRFARMPQFGDAEPDDADVTPGLPEPPPIIPPIADAPVPVEAPRPAMSALSSFRELFHAGVGEETE